MDFPVGRDERGVWWMGNFSRDGLAYHEIPQVASGRGRGSLERYSASELGEGGVGGSNLLPRWDCIL